MRRKLGRAIALGLAGMALTAPAVVAAQAKPVVAVLYFDNNSIGKDRADYDGIGRGMADMLITDMAASPEVRVVDRERIQALLVEQNLTKEKTIDQTTAIRLGKIIGAQYMITGGFMSDGRGTYVLTARAINVETSAITNPVRLTTKGDDVLGLMSQMSEKVRAEMKLPALRVGEAGGAGGAKPAGAAMAEAKPADAKPTEAKAAEPKAGEAKAMMPKPSPRVAQSQPKMDIRTAMLYSKALEEEDAGNKTKAVDLYRQVVAKFPDYGPAKARIAKLSG